MIISLDRDKFSTLMTVFSMLIGKNSKNVLCDSVSIKGGKIYQFSNSRRCFFDIDLSPILGNIDLVLNNISLKSKLLEPFRKQQINIVNLQIDDEDINKTTYYFKDNHSMLEFKKPKEDGLKNVFENPAEIKEKILNINEDVPIFSCDMKRYILDRMYSYSNVLGSESIILTFNNEKVSFSILMNDNKSSTTATIMQLDDVNTDITGTCAFISSIFMLNTDDIFIEAYKSLKKEDNIVLKVNTVVGENPSVNVKIWSPSVIIPLKGKKKEKEMSDEEDYISEEEPF